MSVRLLVCTGAVLVASWAAPSAAWAAGTTTMVSVDSAGVQANSASFYPVVSADGRYVVFASSASNLVAGDTNGWYDVFLRDTQANTTARVSVGSDGAQGNDHSQSPAVSPDGRYVAFASMATNFAPTYMPKVQGVFLRDAVSAKTTLISANDSGTGGDQASNAPSVSTGGRFVAFKSYATNLVAGDTNAVADIFVRDTTAGTTIRVSVSSAGAQANGASSSPYITPDGRYVVFYSDATDLVAGDTNGAGDIFVRDLQTGTTTRASVGSAGVQGNGAADSPSISADGRYVAFRSLASNVVSGDTNAAWDVFVRDVQTGDTSRVSLDSAGAQANSDSRYPSISPDGRYVTFGSRATNLVGGDTNGNWDVFVRDCGARTTTLVHADSAGVQGNTAAFESCLSAGGGRVAFLSTASNLVAGDTNASNDVFIRDGWKTSAGGVGVGSGGVSADGGSGVTVRFETVTSPGDVSVVAQEPARAAPDGFRLLGNACYEISTTAGHTGWIEITFPIPADYAGDAGALKVFHWEQVPAGSGTYRWTQCEPTLGLGTLTIRVDSLSPFALGEPTPVVGTPASSPWSLALFAAGVLIVLPVSYRLRASR